MQIREVSCENCGASLEWDGKYGETVKCNFCNSTFIPTASDAEDVWLMTDPVARSNYEFEGKLDKLEHDIRFEVLRGKDWSEPDWIYLQEIDRLERDGLIRRLASFWAVSPHPPIFRALADGEVILGEKKLPFREGDEITWACPMTRDLADMDHPVLIGDFQDSRMRQLCGEMSNAMMARMR
jgi:hypothetical protein